MTGKRTRIRRRIIRKMAHPYVMVTVGMGIVILTPIAGLGLSQLAVAQSATVTNVPVTAARVPAPQTAPTPQRPRIDWQAAAARHQRGIVAKTTAVITARLPRPELDKTRLPILLPRSGGALKTAQARLISFGDAYSMNLPQGDGVQITLSGNAAAEVAPKGAISRLEKRAARIQGVAEPVQIDRTEDGWTATFTRFNVTYTADLTCDDSEAAACKTDSYLRTVVADLTDVVLGAAALAEARAAGANL
ncbi:hypothetical protein [Asticcacaulis machinosus]|uniref:Uncharacterized protein n=1 Tax=Asticcacaulis machinosus TaxID=2984211 RepID=A0ABT5HH77_9CAUL|nr:hypothetical protein [Asticcacaulis machinosus]MDC7675604.1 hypothetical protein [Asticcacaulis machinosus]